MNKFTEVIESKAMRITLRLVAVLLLPVILILFLYGLVFLYGSMTDFNLIALSFGLSALLGLLGYVAAWYRIFKKRESMSSSQVHCTRLGLFCGITASIMLLLVVAFFKLGIFAIIFFILLVLAGTAFVSATPKSIEQLKRGQD